MPDVSRARASPAAMSGGLADAADGVHGDLLVVVVHDPTLGEGGCKEVEASLNCVPVRRLPEIGGEAGERGPGPVGES